MNSYYKVVFKITIILGLLIVASIIYNSSLHKQNIDSLVVNGKNPSHNSFKKHSQYKLIIDLQNSFIKNAKNVSPSVVNISKVYEEIDIKQLRRFDSEDKSKLMLYLKIWVSKIFSNKKYTSETIGSGLIINKFGYILTNYHVIENQEKILIRLSDNRHYFAKIIGIDPLTDLAVLKINSFKSFPFSSIKPIQDVKVGQWVMAIGNPYGLQGSVTVGVISGISRSDLGITTYENFIQTDASINPGNSGGPLIDLHGNVIGINTTGVTIGSGIGFAIPIQMAMRIVEKLINKGNVERGWLGAGIQGLNPELAISFKIPWGFNKGILINTVKDHTPAKNGGMKRGDIIIQYDGKQILNTRIFKNLVANTKVGKKVPIKIIRNGNEKLLLVTIGKLNS